MKRASLRRPWTSIRLREFFPPVNSIRFGKQPSSELVFSALVGFPFLRKVFDLRAGNKMVIPGEPDVAGSLANHRSLIFHQKKSESSERNMLEHCRDGGANCLLTTTPVSCAGGHLYSTLWWLFHPVVSTRGVQWKPDEGTKYYLTQMLLAINLRYLQAGKNYKCSRSPHASALHWIPPRFLQKTIMSDIRIFVQRRVLLIQKSKSTVSTFFC